MAAALSPLGGQVHHSSPKRSESRPKHRPRERDRVDPLLDHHVAGSRNPRRSGGLGELTNRQAVGGRALLIQP